MLKLMSKTILIITAALAAHQAAAQDFSSESATVLTAASTAGKSLKLVLPEFPVTKRVKAVSICSEPGQAVIVAKLWMPGMGHGSAPTQLAPAGDGCTAVSNVQFVMRGEWQIQVTLQDGDTGVFDVVVE